MLILIQWFSKLEWFMTPFPFDDLFLAFPRNMASYKFHHSHKCFTSLPRYGQRKDWSQIYVLIECLLECMITRPYTIKSMSMHSIIPSSKTKVLPLLISYVISSWSWVLALPLREVLYYFEDIRIQQVVFFLEIFVNTVRAIALKLIICVLVLTVSLIKKNLTCII